MGRGQLTVVIRRRDAPHPRRVQRTARIHADGRAINEDFRETFIRADAELCAAAPELLAENERAHEFFEAINGAIHEAVSAKPIVPGAALVELILLFPPRILNPNNRAHWSTKAKAAKSYKRECWAVAKHSGWFGREFTPKVHLWIDFYPPDKRPYDDDNIAAAFKAGRDGIASALGIDDKRFVSHPTLFPFSKDFKGVKVRITDSP